MDNNYVVYHLHSDLSLLDSVTKFQAYVDRAVELGQKAIAFTEHGNIFQWVAKKLYCDKVGIKYIHGVECYLTEKLVWVDPDTGEEKKVRDNFHTILLARNPAGLREINSLVSLSNRGDHFYYKPRITFDEFLRISGNVIKISACLASPLNRLPVSHPMYEKLLRYYDYLEIQPHNHPDQIAYNIHLAEMSEKYHIPLIAGTDTHSLNFYKAECRTILQLAKNIEFADEDSFDLTYKSYDELSEMFRVQDALPEKIWRQAIENTNIMADSVEDFELDTSIKYPVLYGDEDAERLDAAIEQGLREKTERGAIVKEQIPAFREAIQEERRVFKKINMMGFMLFMSELVCWCKSNGIPVGFGRGSVAGSRVAYLTDITDVNPETWHTVFSRFANEDRVELGDIDIDVSPSDRDRVYDYIINRFGRENTAYILAIGTVKSRGAIDEIVRALGVRWNREHQEDIKKLKEVLKRLKTSGVRIQYNDAVEFYDIGTAENSVVLPYRIKGIPVEIMIKRLSDQYEKIRKENARIAEQNPYSLKLGDIIKKAFESKPDETRKKYPDIFYYYDGILDAAVSQSMHPAGIVAAPLTLRDNYGTLISDGKEILQIDMDGVHEANLAKYDILGLKNIQIIKNAYELLNKPYPKSYEIDWNDQNVWADMLRSPVGVFQFEGEFAFSMLRQFKPTSIFDMSLVTACIRPSGASYRDQLLKRIPHKNPSPMIDDLLKENLGYIVYQEDSLKFLQQICGMSGSESDNVRRGIARKQKDRLDAALPAILEGYCAKSPQPREIAEQEAKEFLQIIEDSASYQFGYNHSVSYCLIGYLCAYLRYYHPAEFITAYLNNADGEDDVKSGSELAEAYGIKIVPPRFGLSKDQYIYDKNSGVIAKGIASVKYLNSAVANELYQIAHENNIKSFMDLLKLIAKRSSLDVRQRDILIKIDFFREFGNIPTLSRIVSFFTMLKGGEAKKIQKSKITGSMADIIVGFATDKNKSGQDAKFYTITDMDGLLNACEQAVRELNLPDLDLKIKIQNQIENLGYADVTTGKQEDRRKLLIEGVTPLKNKETGNSWGYALNAKSIGSGKTARLTVRERVYRDAPVRKGDIIFAKDFRRNQKGYWYLTAYTRFA